MVTVHELSLARPTCIMVLVFSSHRKRMVYRRRRKRRCYGVLSHRSNIALWSRRTREVGSWSLEFTVMPTGRATERRYLVADIAPL